MTCLSARLRHAHAEDAVLLVIHFVTLMMFLPGVHAALSLKEASETPSPSPATEGGYGELPLDSIAAVLYGLVLILGSLTALSFVITPANSTEQHAELVEVRAVDVSASVGKALQEALSSGVAWTDLGELEAAALRLTWTKSRWEQELQAEAAEARMSIVFEEPAAAGISLPTGAAHVQELSIEHFAKLRHDFDSFDGNGSGVLDETEMEALLVCSELESASEKLDRDGQFDFKCYVDLIHGDWKIAKVTPDDYSMLGLQYAKIEGAENRPLSLKQLQRIREFIQSQTNEAGEMNWIDLAPPQYSNTSGQKLKLHEVNLYSTATWLIEPCTREAESSYSELVNREAKQPKTFVSHWWGEPVLDFIAAVEHHAKVRLLSGDDGWWICAYANNQHKLNEDIDPDPKKTGCALSCFEEGMYIQNRDKSGWRLKLDVATVVKRVEPKDEVHLKTCKECKVWPIRGLCYAGFCQLCYDNKDEEHKNKLSLHDDPDNLGPQLITEGLAASDDPDYPEEKAIRGMTFPLAILARAYTGEMKVKTTQSQATMKEDFKRIINSINGVPVAQLDTLEPDLAHNNCRKVDRALRSMFAEAALWPAALAANGAAPDAFGLAMAAISEDTNRTKLTIDLSFLQKLPDMSPVGEALQKLVKLQELEVILYKRSEASLPPEVAVWPQLTSLNLAACRNLTSLPEATNWPQLSSMKLSGCHKLTSLPEAANWPQLTSLYLISCRSLTSLPEAANWPQLTSLDLLACASLTSLPKATNWPKLSSLHLRFCKSLTSLPEAANWPQLSSLVLSCCSSLTSLPEAANWPQLSLLNLHGCTSLTSLPKASVNWTQLQTLILENKASAQPNPTSLRSLPQGAVAHWTRLDEESKAHPLFEQQQEEAGMHDTVKGTTAEDEESAAVEGNPSELTHAACHLHY